MTSRKQPGVPDTPSGSLLASFIEQLSKGVSEGHVSADDLRLAITLGAGVFSFGRWSAGEDPDAPERHVVEIEDAADFPEVFVLATEGFMNRLADARGSPPAWRAERPFVDVIRFRTIRPV